MFNTCTICLSIFSTCKLLPIIQKGGIRLTIGPWKYFQRGNNQEGNQERPEFCDTGGYLQQGSGLIIIETLRMARII